MAKMPFQALISANLAWKPKGGSMSKFAWLYPVLIAAAIVFVVDLIGNYITFNNRFLNALVQAVLFAIVFGALTAYFTPAEVTVTPVGPASP